MNEQLLVLHLGSNMGNRLDYLSKALKHLEISFEKPSKISGIYQTAAWGETNQADFLNMAAIYKVSLQPEVVFKTIKNIETEIGRMSREHWHEREIDIDIVFYGNSILKNSVLQIPHAEMQHRRFVLQPLNEICPEYIHPVLNKSVSQLLEECPDKLKVELWKEI